MYQNGEGVTTDLVEAVRWYRESAEQGNSGAQFNLGGMYQRGEGVTEDFAEAVRWYRESADQGDSEAQFKLGTMYQNGEGVTTDLVEAVRWYRKSAEQGNGRGQFFLGGMYAKGEGVTKDLAEAVKWMQKASSDTNPEIAKAAEEVLQSLDVATLTIEKQSGDFLDEMVKNVRDPDSGKDGGPTTRDVIRILNGGGQDNVYGDSAVIVGAFLQGMTQGMAEIEEIRRGKILTSFFSTAIPTGTEVFPIRVILSSQIGAPQQDLYFFKDEFGDWSAIPKQ